MCIVFMYLFMKRTHSCRSTSRSNNGGTGNGGENKHVITSNDMKSPTNSQAEPTDNNNGNASSKFNRNRTMTLPVRRRSRSSPSNRSSRAGTDQSPQQQPGSRQEPELQMPDNAPGPDVAVYRVRTFTTKSGNVVNRGDSIKIRNRSSGRSAAGAPSAGRSSPANATTVSGHVGIHRSSSSDSRPQSPGSKTGGWGGMSARDRREALSRHSSRGGRSSVSGDDVQFPVSPSASIGAVAASLASEQPLLETEMISMDQIGIQENDIEDEMVELDNRGRVIGGQGQDSNGTHRDTNDNGVTMDNEPPVPVYKVLVLGSQGVGKTTLVEQLMTSEYLANKENCTTGEYMTSQRGR